MFPIHNHPPISEERRRLKREYELLDKNRDIKRIADALEKIVEDLHKLVEHNNKDKSISLRY